MGFMLDSEGSGPSDYFAFGVMTGVARQQVERLDDPVWLFEFSLVPRLRVPFGELPHEVYLSAPVGLLMDATSFDPLQIGAGWKIGVQLGVQLFVTPGFGFFAEGSWSRASLYTEDVRFDERDRPDIELKMIRWLASTGVVFAF